MKKTFLKIMILFLLITIICNVNFAKYIEKIILKSETKIAKPIIEIEKEEKIIITKIDLEEQIEYKFKIKNFNEKEKSNIEFLYFIEILSDISNEQIDLKIIDLATNNGLELINNKTENIKINKEEYEREYKIQVKLKQENLNANINIKIGVVQNR